MSKNEQMLPLLCYLFQLQDHSSVQVSVAIFKFPYREKKKLLLSSCNSGKKPPNLHKYCITIVRNIQDSFNYGLKQHNCKDDTLKDAYT